MRSHGRFLGMATVASLLLVGSPRAEEIKGDCYRFLFHLSDFSTTQIVAFAYLAEERCQLLQSALGVRPQEAITVYLRPGPGISSTLSHRNKAVDLHYSIPIGGIEAPLIHETTHILVHSPHPILREGLATAMEQKFGSLKAHPTYGISMEEWVVAIECSGRRISLDELEDMDWGEGPWETNLIAYNLSGSFVAYLVESLGMDQVVRTLQWTQRVKRISLERICRARFDSSLEELQGKWLKEVRSKGDTALAHELCVALKDGKVQQFLKRVLTSP